MWKPLNVIILGEMETDIISQKITIPNCVYLVMFSKWDI